MSYAEVVNAARRQSILLALFFAPAYKMSAAGVKEQVEATGFATSSDKLAVELSWLAEMQLIDALENDVFVLTSRGEDITLGRSQIPGVRRPSPGELKNGSH